MAEKDTENGNGPVMNDLLHCAGDRAMFIKAANAGLPALLWVESAGLFFRCEVTDDCIFTKKLLGASPGGVKLGNDADVGKSFSCRYEKGHFSPPQVETPIEGLESCQGPLVGALRSWLKLTITRESVKRGLRRLASGKEASPTAAAEKASFFSPALLNKKIIIAEQDSQLTWCYDSIFRAVGFKNIYFSPERADETFKMALELQADLVIARMYMPMRSGGEEFCRLLREHPKTRHIKIIMCTGCELVSCQEALNYGVSAYVPKPFEITIIPVIVAEILCGLRDDYPPIK